MQQEKIIVEEKKTKPNHLGDVPKGIQAQIPVKRMLLAKILRPNNSNFQLDSKQAKRLMYNFTNVKMKSGKIKFSRTAPVNEHRSTESQPGSS